MNRTILSVINQKGGVGKTTTVINLSTALAQQNNKILIIDLDPQGNATTGLGKSNSDEQNNVYNLLINKVSRKLCPINGGQKSRSNSFECKFVRPGGRNS